MENLIKNDKILPIGNIEEIGKYIRKKRKALNITQADLAGMCNCGTRFISDLENGKPTLQIEKVFHILRSLGIDIFIKDR